jgi:Fur family transcriptional regulator, ferric uptake regulator
MKLTEMLLKSPGARLTSQRTLVFDIISRGGGHLGADEIYARAHRKNPRISLSTVYRAIAKFKELGLVVESHLGQEHHHYEAGHNGNHFHLICIGCGAVIEFAYPLVDRVRDEVSRANGFTIVSAEMNLSGYCPQCRG